MRCLIVSLASSSTSGWTSGSTSGWTSGCTSGPSTLGFVNFVLIAISIDFMNWRAFPKLVSGWNISHQGTPDGLIPKIPWLPMNRRVVKLLNCELHQCTLQLRWIRDIEHYKALKSLELECRQVMGSKMINEIILHSHWIIHQNRKILTDLEDNDQH